MDFRKPGDFVGSFRKASLYVRQSCESDIIWFLDLQCDDLGDLAISHCKTAPRFVSSLALIP